MPNIGWPELVVVLLIVLVVFGAGRLPQIGEGIGKAIRNLKRGLKTDDDIEVTPKEAPPEKRSTEKLPPRTTSREKIDEEVAEGEVVEHRNG